MSSTTSWAISLNLWYRMFAEEHCQRHGYSLTNNVGLRGGCNKMADGKSFFIGGKLKWVQIPSVGLNLELIPVYTNTNYNIIIWNTQKIMIGS